MALEKNNSGMLASRTLIDAGATAALVAAVGVNKFAPTTTQDHQAALSAGKDAFFEALVKESNFKEAVLFTSKLAVRDSKERSIFRAEMVERAEKHYMSPKFASFLATAILEDVDSLFTRVPISKEALAPTRD